MGYYVREAGLIVVADTRRDRERSQTVVLINEVIKGDPKMAGMEIRLGGGRKWSSADVYLPTPATNVTILLQKEWRNEQKKWPILEAYAKAEDAVVVRALVEIYRLPRERDRLLALREKALAGNACCIDQLLEDLRDMRSPENFDVMTGLYDDIAPADQIKLVDIMGETGDPRTVTPLLKAMQSSNEKVGITAARKLSWAFPGAPGVTEAFEKALKQEHLMREAARYLSKRRDVPEWNELCGKSESDWHRANKSWDAGDMKAARVAYLEIIENNTNSRYVRFSSATKLLPHASTVEKERIRKALLSQLLADASGDNYLHVQEAVHIMRELHHIDCLEALIEIVLRGDRIHRIAGRVATLAIRELGSEARQKCTGRLLKNLDSDALKINDRSLMTIYLMKLIWLGDQESFARVEKVLPVSWKSTWEALGPLRLMIDEKDEASGFIHLLAQSEDFPEMAGEWIIFYLGDLKEKRAVNTLVEILIHHRNQTLTRAARDALIGIGGTEVENEMLKFMTLPDRTRRRMAVEVLFGMKGARACELSRRMLREDDFGLKSEAIFHLGYHGTVDDLALLLPYCNYWISDRDTHSRARWAVSNIRERHNYDVNGPIVRELQRSASVPHAISVDFHICYPMHTGENLFSGNFSDKR